MAWNKGKQPYRKEFSAEAINKEILEMDGFLEESTAKYYLYLFLRNNIGFASELLLGIKLFPFQCLLIKGMMVGDFSMYVLGRGMSKTFSAGVYVMLQLLFKQGIKIGVLSSGFRQAKMIFGKVEDILKREGSSIVKDLFKLTKGTDQWTLTCGDSQALALPLADGSRLRGFRFSILLLDEFLNISKNVFLEVILPFLGVIDNPTERADMKELEDLLIAEGKMKEEDRYQWDNNKLILLSSPSWTFEYMYDVYKLYRDMILDVHEPSISEEDMLVESEDAYRIIFQLSYDCAPDTLYDHQQLIQAKATMSEAIFAKEYGAQFVSESDSYFKLSKMEACTIDDGESPHIELVGNPDHDYIVSIDPSWSEDSGSDDFALEVFKLNYNDHTACQVHTYGIAGMPMKNHIKYFHYILTHFNVKAVCLDYAGGVTFVSACNESSIFKDSKIELGVLNDEIDGDLIKSRTYDQDLRQFKAALSPTQHKYCYHRVPSSNWIREANELLQANIDHKRIHFASQPRNQAYTDEKKKTIPMDFKWDRKWNPKSHSMENNMIEFLDHQFFMMELTKQQCANIEVTTNPQGSQTFRLPPFMTRIDGPNKPRKDNYSALLLGNWMAKIYFDSLEIEEEAPVEGGFTPFLI